MSSSTRSQSKKQSNAEADASSATGGSTTNQSNEMSEGQDLLLARLSALEEESGKSRKELERLLAIIREREGEMEQLRKSSSTTTTDSATKKRARETTIEIGDDDVGEVPPTKIRAGVFEPKTEWSKLMLPSTTSEKNVEILSSIENLGRHAHAGGSEVRSTLVNLIAGSPDAKTIASFSDDGYEIIAMLTEQLQKSMRSKKEVRRKPSMKAVDYFNQKLATMTQDDLLVENRRALLREFVLCDDTITATQRKKCFDIIEKIDFKNKKDKDHMLTKVQLARIWTEAEISLEAGEAVQHGHRQKGKHRQQSSSDSSAPQRQQQANPSGSTSTKPPPKPAKGAKQPKVPPSECKWCNNLDIHGAQALHYGFTCPNNPKNANANPLNE